VNTARIKAEWPFWEDLHVMWKELPNYRVIGVSNSSSGQDLAEDALDLLFGQELREQAESLNGEEDSDDDELGENSLGSEKEEDLEVDELKSDVKPEVCNVHNITIYSIQ
jgi:hypothetical protein